MVRCHSHLKKSSSARLGTRNAQKARGRCYTNVEKYAKEVLDGSSASQITPMFSQETAHSFFKEVYHAAPRNYVQPAWMPNPHAPEFEMDCSPFTPSEVIKVIKKMKSRSAPSPFDRVGYKKCPALVPALFNICWSHSFIPDQWKTAAIKLIAKGSAVEDATNPGNFRPIAMY